MKKGFILVLIGMLIFGLAVLPGCKKDDSSTTPGVSTDNSDIPADPGGVAPNTTINNVSPAATIAKVAGNPNRIQINLLGIIDPTTNQPITYTLNKWSAYNPNAANLFVMEDSVLQGIKLTRVGSGTTLSADVVFIVDNSGSMSEEADTIASKIISFSNYLAASGLNVRVGCVGYEYGDVNGARNLTDAQSLRAYLNRPSMTGTYRTVEAGGPDSAKLAGSIATFPRVSAEDGIVAIWFADSLFSWRPGAQRIYINFTDEATQPGGDARWTTAGLKARWTPAKGSIHTVFSLASYYWNGTVPDTTMEHENGVAWTAGSYERPWSLSHFSGGTVKIVHNDGSDLNLTTLPVTGALAASNLVEFVTSNPGVNHTVTITVKTPTADGKTVFRNITY